MNVEGGGIGGIGGGAGVSASIAPAVGAIHAGPSLGLEARFGPAVVGLSSSIVSEGPVGLADLKNTMPLQLGFNPAGEIRFNNPLEGNVAVESFSAEAKSDLAEAVIAEAEAILSQTRANPVQGQNPLVGENVVAEANHWLGIEDWFIDDNNLYDRIPYCHRLQGAVTTTENALGVQTGSQPKLESQEAVSQFKTENKASALVVPAVTIQPTLQEQEEEELVEEQVIKDETGTEEEEIAKVIRKYVVDDRALSQIVVEFKEAITKAKELAKRLGIKLTGKLFGKFLPSQHPGNESEAIKGKSQDGSILERQQSIEELGEFSSDVQAEEKAVKVASEKPPLKIRSEGKPVKDEDVRRVYKGYRVKPKAVIEVITKIIKKNKLAVQLGQKPIEAPVQIKVSGNKIEDYPQLAEVFPKAA